MKHYTMETLLDDFADFIDYEITQIEIKAFNAGYDRGHEIGRLQLTQSNIENEYEAYNIGWGDAYDEIVSMIDNTTEIENEYYAYREGFADAWERDGHIRLYYNKKTRAFATSDIDWNKDGHRDYMTDFDLRNTED